ncbi:MAG TPA: sigma-70 family RNA polymerase sigma factor [Verrucomicrobiae bacterium]|nr:sigma-70 family RNA polymerase sigma factor [Verrucomicrobiae bacterium]
MLIWQNKNGKTETGRLPEGNASVSDAELVRGARRGAKKAFVEIVARHQAMVCGVALGILGDFAASEDAGQEAFLTAWRKLHELREPERLRAWLAQIARNAALGQLRRTRGHESLDDALALPDESPLPDENAASEEDAAMVRASLAKLPETYRLPLVLFYREGQSVRTVAETLGVSEDAVKQRLARGREMLRDRMSGLVETVLTRSAPSAVFTMTIAAAIGALALPSAVASTAFAATATVTGAASTSAASSTSVLTAMSTSKTFLVVTALVAVAFVPVGYQISNTRQTVAPAESVSRAETEVAPTQSFAPSFESSALFAEWRALHEKHGNNAAAMPVLYQAIADLKDPFRRRAFQTALISEWVQVDPKGGLKFYLGKGRDNNQRRQFIEEWLALDPGAAVDGLLASESGWETVAFDCLAEIARRVPSRLADVVARLPKNESYWDTSVRDAFAIVAEGDLVATRKAAEAMNGPNREPSLAGVALAWARSDFNGAVTWARSFPEGIDRDQVVRAALLGLAGVNPAAALDSANLVPPGGRYAHFADTTGARVLRKAAETDFDATAAWLVDHPGRFGREDLLGLAHPVSDRLNANAAGFLSAWATSGSLSALVPAIESALLNDSGGQRTAVWEWLKTQPVNEATKALRAQVLSSSAYQDPDLALRLVSELPQTKEGKAELEALAVQLFNGGSALHRFDKLYPQAPERLQQPLLEAAFSYLDSLNYNLSAPQDWIARLSLLPESARTKGTESIARAWAKQSPEEAIAWVASLAQADTRNGAMAAIASTWAAKDAYGAAEWVASMPPGVARDRSAESLSLAIAEHYPREAWEWALNINDTAARNRAATQAVKTMAARDLATAQQWIQTGPFSADDRTKLLASIQQPGRVNP